VAVEDPRCSGKVEHRLVEVLVIAVCAVIACAESWDDIALYGRSKLAWLRTFLELANGIPSHDTFRRVFMLIDPDAFEAGFAAWVGSLVDRFEREVVAIDGKTVRRSFDHGREQSALHVVSAWASEQGLVLGQRCVDGKSNEITAVPELLVQLVLENSIVTLDAMGCQTAIAEKILARGGDYLLTLKGNHPLAHAAVVEHFDQHCFRVGAPHRADCDAFGPESTKVPPGTHKPCRKTLRRGFPRTPPIRHCFSFKVYRGFSVQSGLDLECAEYTCFPLSDCVSITEENGQNTCSAWVWDRPVRALSAYAYQEALPLVGATLEWVDWLNNRRPLEPIGNIPPAEAEANYYAMLDDMRAAA